MSAEEFLEAIIKYNIIVSPILERKRKKTTTKCWYAGLKKLSGDNITNIIDIVNFSFGNTPIQAVEKLLKRETVYKYENNILVQKE